MRKFGGSVKSYLSTAGHVESRGNLGGPSSKAKYDILTDSVQYREGKREKNPVRGVK